MAHHGKFPRLILLLALAGTCAPLTRAQLPANATVPTAEDVAARVVEFISVGRQPNAERLLDAYAAENKGLQRIDFLRAVCRRSRLLVQKSTPFLESVVGRGTNSPSGRCAYYLLQMDARRDVQTQLAMLEALVRDWPDDLVLRWTLAMQYQAVARYKDSELQCRELLKQWSPGPAPLHALLAKALTEQLNLTDALQERRTVLAIEPTASSQQDLAWLLTQMSRFDEANQAYAESARLEPASANAWRNWALGLQEAGQHEGAVQKCARAAALKNNDWLTLSVWGESLCHMGRRAEALEKYRAAQQLHPAEHIRIRIAALERAIATQAQRTASPSLAPPGSPQATYLAELANRDLGSLLLLFGKPVSQRREDFATWYDFKNWRTWRSIGLRVTGDSQLGRMLILPSTNVQITVREWCAALQKDFGIRTDAIRIETERMIDGSTCKRVEFLHLPPGVRGIDFVLPDVAVPDASIVTLDALDRRRVVNSTLSVRFVTQPESP